MTVESPVLDELQIEVGSAFEHRTQPDLACDHGEQRHLYAVDQARSHQRSVHREAAM